MPSASGHDGLRFAKTPHGERPEKPCQPVSTRVTPSRDRTVAKPVTHDQLTRYAKRWLTSTHRPPCVAVIRHRGAKGEIADVIGWLWNGVSTVVECKVSRSDLRRDAHKKARHQPGIGRYRYLLVPAGLADGVEPLPGWGLLELRGRVGRVCCVRKSHDFEQRFYGRSINKELLVLVGAVARGSWNRDGSDGVEVRQAMREFRKRDWEAASLARSRPQGGLDGQA